MLFSVIGHFRGKKKIGINHLTQPCVLVNQTLPVTDQGMLLCLTDSVGLVLRRQSRNVCLTVPQLGGRELCCRPQVRDITWLLCISWMG
jgi:hypothetical protein